MKHLICILAHKNASHVELLTSECLQRGYEVIIHIDKKNRKQLLQDSELLKKHTLKESIDVTRAHITIVEASLLFFMAVKYIDYDYVYVISGEDFIVESVNCFEAFSTFKCKPLINIHDVVVVNEFRGLDLSQQMLSKVEEIAKLKGCCKITLEVLEGNKVAQKSYIKFGFAGYELDPIMGKALFWQRIV